MVILVLCLQVTQPLQAATLLWDSNVGVTQVQDGAGTWTTLGTTWWNPASAGSNVVITSADVGFFGAGGMGGAITLSEDQPLLGMIFGRTVTTGYSFTAGSAITLTLGASGITVLQGAQPVTIGDANLSLVLGAAQTWTNRSNGSLTLSSGIDNGGNALTLNGVAGLTGGGQYSLNGVLSGAGGLTLGRNASATITTNSTYSGATVIGNASTLTVSGAAGRISGTSGITLNGGNLTMLSATGEQSVDRVNAAAITSNGGTITWTNPAGDAGAWAETLGVLSLAKGRTNIVTTNAVSGTQALTLGTGSLTRPGGSTATISFAGASLGAAQNRIFVSGLTATMANQIIGPWATFGASAASQTDYAIYNATTGIQARNVATSAETTWTTAANTYSFTGAFATTATRTINSLRFADAGTTARTLTVGGTSTAFNLATFGILNGSTNPIGLTIANGASNTGGLTTPTGGDNTLYLIGGTSTISVTAPIIDNGTAVNVVKSGNSNVTFSGSNTYTGATTINSGLLVSGSAVSATFNGGAASWLGASSAAAANLVLDGGTLRYAGPTAGTTDRLFTLGEAGGTIDNNAASNGTLAFAATGSIVAAGTGDRTLTLNGNGTGSFTFSPVIVDPVSGTTSLVINSGNTGPVILNPSANNTFTGGITINGRTLQVRNSNSLGANVVTFGTGTTPTLDIRADAATNFGSGGSSLFVENNATITPSRVTSGGNLTHTIGALTIGTVTLTLTRGANWTTNNAGSVTTGAVALIGDPTFNLNLGSGTAAPVLNLGVLNDGGVARTITITGGASGTGKQYLRLFNNVTSFTAGTNIVYNGGNVGGVRLDTANSFGTATNPGLVTFAAPSTVGGVRLLNNTANTNFTTNWVLGDNSVLFDLGGTSANQTNKGLITGTLSIGTSTLTLNGAINTSADNVYSLTMGATTFTGNATFNVANVSGTAIGSLTLGTLSDGTVARTLTKNGLATLQLNSAATSIVGGTTLSTSAGITQIGNATAFGDGTLRVGDGATTGQLRIADTVTLSNNTIVTYLGGTATLGTGSITGPTTGTGTINSIININAAPGADTGHFQGGGGTLNITGSIVTGGTSGGEIVIRAGNVGLNNVAGNTYTSLRVNAGTTTVGVTDAIPTGANVFLAELASAGISIASGLSQTITSTATWTLGGTGPTLENNVGTIATGTGALVLNGTIANNTGSLATQLVTGAVSFGGTSGTFNIDSGHASSDMTVSADLSSGSLIKEGAGILTLTGTKMLTGLTINNGAVVGGFGTSGVQTITIGSAGSLQLVNFLAETLTLAGSAGSLNVAGGARIGLELGAPSISDTLTVGTGGTAATTGTITLDFYNLGGLAAGTYTLLTAPSGLITGGTTYNVGSAPLGFNYTINATDTLVELITTAYTPRFWTGSQATTSWNTVNAGPLTNWSTDAAGLTNSTNTPASNHTVIFSASNATGPTISTTLDAAFTIDALQFLAAPTGVTAVNIAAGTGGTLNVAPATSSAGIFVDTNAGTATLAAALPYTVGNNQTWNLVGGGANGSALVIAADVNFNSFSVTKSGAGVASLSGTNSGAGTLTLSAGTLNLNSAAALGSVNFTINGGSTLNNTSGGAVALSTTNAITLNGNFTFTGTQNLSFANNAASLPTNVSITTTGGILTLNGVITESGGSRSLTKLGAGALTLGGNNAFAGGVNLNSGILNLNHEGALGSGTLTIVGGTLDNTSGAAIINANNNVQTWNGNFAFTGTDNLNLGAGAISLGSGAGTSRTVTVNSGTLTVGGIISNGAVGTGITKAGTGTLTLSGASTYTGNTVVQAGNLNITGSLAGNNTATTITTGTVAGTTTLNIAGDISLFNIQGANLAGSNTVWNQTAGLVTVTPGTGNNNFVANVSGSYGYFNLSGGTYKNTGRFIVANGATSIGVVRVSGAGLLDNSISGGASPDWLMISQGGIGELTVLSGGTVDHTGAGNPLAFTLNQSNGFGLLNLAGGTVSTNSLRSGNSTSTVITNNVSIANLAAGTLNTSQGFTKSFGGNGTVANVYISYAGATIKTTAAVTTFIPTSTASNPQVTYSQTLFGAIDNSAVSGAPSFAGGLTFDTNGFTTTNAESILGAQTSSGVTQANISLAGGSGYSGPPIVQFSTVGVVAGGTPASGYALVSGGQVTGIVITNPGTYASGSTPTVTLVGGGGSGASVTVSALNTTNGIGGLTVNGGGQLTLAGASSYAGISTVTGAGTVLASTSALGNIGSAGGFGLGDATSTATNAASIVIDGATLRTSIASAQSTDRLFTLTQNGGQLDSNNGTAANTMTWTNTNAIAYSGSGARTFILGGANIGDNTFAPQIGNGTGGATTLAKTGAGRWIVANTGNDYTGGTNIAAGTLGFNAGNTLGSTGNITFTGASTLLWNGTNMDDLSSRLFLADTITGTVDTGANNVIFANAVGTTGGTTGILNKAGAGALSLNANATHTGGTTLTAGTLNLGIAGAVGSGLFTIAGGTLDNTSGSTMTLAGNPAQSWSGNFTFTGTHDLNLGTGAVDLTANRTVTVTAGTLTVDGIIGDTGGDFGLIKAGAGTLHLKGVNTFGADDNVTIQGGTLIVDAASGLGDATNNVIFNTAAGTLRFTDDASFGAGQYFRAAGVAATIEVDANKLVEIAGGPTSSATNGFNTNGGTNGPGASVIKTGLGTLRISGGNGFFDGDGGWVVTQGTLSIAGNNTAVLGDATPATVALRLNGGTVSYDTDTANIVNAAIGTVLQANSTVVSNVATAGAGISQSLNALTVNVGGLLLNVQGGSNVTSGTAGITTGAVTLNGDVTFNITDPTGGGTTLLSLGAVAGGASGVTLTGNGDFVQTGAIASSAASSFTLGGTYSGLAILSQANTYSGGTIVNGGTLSFSTSANLGDASATNDITLGGGLLQFTPATTVDLTANRQINLTSATTSTVEVTSATGVLQVTGGFATTALSHLTKTGLGTLEVTNALDLNAGNLSVNAGTMRSGLALNSVGTLSIATGATLNLYDGAASTANLTGLTLAAGSSLGFDLNAPGSNDLLNLTGTPTIASAVSLNFNNLGGLGVGTYDLLTISSGTLNASNFVLGLAPSGFNYGFTTVGGQTLRLTASTLNLVYWTGDQDGNWNTNNGPGNTNWASDAAGTELGALPATMDTLVFSATNAIAPSGVITTSLNNVGVMADSLRFISAPTTPSTTTVSIASGGASGILTINPASSNNGITVAGLGGDVTIAAAVVVAANQTWEVDGTAPSSLTVSGDVTFTGNVAKTGLGALTLSGTNSGAGGVNLVAGTLILNTATALGTGTFTIGNGTTLTNGSAGALTLITDNLQTWGGSFTFGGSQNLDLGTGAVTMGNNLTAVVNNVLTVGGGIDDGAGTFALTKSGAGTLVLNGANGYDGLTSLIAGTLTLAGNNSNAFGGVTMAVGTTLNINHNNALGAAAGVFIINGGTIDNTSGSAVTNAGNNAQNWNSSFTFTGANGLDLGTGAVTLNVTPTITVSASTLTVGGTIDGAFGLTKNGAGILVLSGLSSTAVNNYSGTTTLDGGTTTINGTAVLSGGLTLGASNTSANSSTLNLNSGSATFGGAMTVQTNNPVTANTITIGTTQALTVNGNVTIGSSSGTNTTTKLAVSGLGAFNVTNAASSGTFTVGGSNSTGGVGSIAEADFSGLAAMNVNLSGTSSVITVNPNLTGGTTNVNNLDATLRLAATSTLTATTLTVGGGPTNNGSAGQRNELYLGATATTINADTINVGTGSRDVGFIGGGGGTLAIADKASTGRAAFNIGAGTAATGAAASGGNVVNLTNVNATLFLSTLTIGGQNRNNDRSDTLFFVTGTLDATTVVVGDNGGTASTTAASNTWTSTLNIGGGTTTIGAGGLEIARGDTAVTGTDVIEGTVNISGGTVTIANSAGLGAAVRLGHNTIAPGANVLTTNGLLNITGGSVSVAGNIIKGATTGAGSATVTLNGGILDMSGNSVGAAGALAVTFNAQSGTLQNLAQINGGAGLTKTTEGTLILEGSNTYTGGTTISTGVLQVGSGSTTGTLGSGTVTNNASLTVNRSNAYTVGNMITGSGQFIQAGSGTTTLSNAGNEYTGKTSIVAGKLSISTNAHLGAAPASYVADQLSLSGGGVLQTTATLAIGANRGITVATGGGAFETAAGTTTTINSVISGGGNFSKEGAGMLIVTAVNTNSGTITVNAGVLGGNSTVGGDLVVASGGTLAPGASAGQFNVTGNLTVNAGGILLMELGGATSNDEAAVRAYFNSFGNLTGLTVQASYEDYQTGVTAHDHIAVTGASVPTINGTLTLGPVLNSYAFQYGDIFDLLDWSAMGGVSGATGFNFNAIDLSPVGLAFNTDLFASHGLIVVVPEPSRVLLLMVGLFGLVLRRRRRM